MRIRTSAENELRQSDQSRILQGMLIRVCFNARAGYLAAPAEAARLLLAGGVRG
jgi:hypothetical protein